MKIKKIEWRNVSSYGNKLQTIELPEKAGLVQIFGENGSGKSTISDVITFGLYGKLENKKLKDIPNRSNGSAWIKITLEQNGRIYEVERGLDPAVFELYIDGQNYDRAGQKNVQEFISEDILRIPYYVFNNTISLSVNDFKSFLKMSSMDKKKIIDKIFGFYVLNEMRELLKEESKNVKSQIEKLSGEILATGKSITNSQRELEILQKKLIENAGQEIQEIEENLKNYRELLVIHTEKLKSFKTKEKNIQEGVNRAYQIYSEGVNSIKEIDKKLSLYNNEKCPTCSSDFSSDFHKSIFEELSEQRILAFSQNIELKNDYEEAKASQQKVSSEKNELFTKGGKIESSIRTLEEKLNSLKTSKNNEQVSSIKKLLSSATQDLETHNSEKFKWEERGEWLRTIDEILSEKGVKQLAIRSILPSLNKEIMETLLSLHLPYKVVFNEEFNAQIFHLGEEISTNTLSTGEMKKVDFAVLVSIIRLMKIRFSSINILFLDEIFSSVDPDGVYSILTTLRKICDELQMNIFVINHAPMPTEIFDYKMEIEKKNNFSEIKFEKIS
jgi:DNA repair exonuclease SbcCD ATPase subunit